MLTTGLVLICIALACFLILWRCRAQDLMDENTELTLKLGVAYKHEHELYKKITELAQESTEAGAELNQQISDNRKLKIMIETQAATIKILESRITISRTTDLEESMTSIVRFIAANQWLIEKDRELAIACESLSGVASSSIDNGDT